MRALGGQRAGGQRAGRDGAGGVAGPAPRPLSARSVIASTLLGTEGLALPVRVLVRAGDLFGVAEGATRVALTRMVAAGELVAGPGPGEYRLAGQLLERSAAQETGRHPRLQDWDGGWSMAVVAGPPRRPADRAALRIALRRLDLAEWREGVWLRPDNLGPPERLPEAARVAREQCTWLSCRLAPGEDRAMANRLWDLAEWASRARSFGHDLRPSVSRLEEGDPAALRPGFLLAAGALRHLAADPLLPPSLLPGRWPGDQLRDDYDRYEVALQRGLRRFFREQS
jgi:phenylacetic acid degradation operon negative regulatory protein